MSSHSLTADFRKSLNDLSRELKRSIAELEHELEKQGVPKEKIRQVNYRSRSRPRK
jgi:hypothetical protein